MKRIPPLVAIALAVSTGCLFGCVPGIDVAPDGGHAGSDESARQLFDRTVAPLVGRCADCHVGPETTAIDTFLGLARTPDSYYAGITNDRRVAGDFSPAAAELLTKGAHAGQAWWSTAEAQAIAGWLVAEAAARDTGSGSDVTVLDGGTGGGDQTSPVAAEQQWAGCLALSTAAYESTQVFQLANMKSDQGQCFSCHAPGGAGGAYWSADKADMLLKWQVQVFLTAPFQLAEVNGTPVHYKMIAGRNKICSKGTEQDRSAGTHPRFDCEQQVNGTKPIDALDLFVTAVQANLDTGVCTGPGAFVPPPT